MTRTLRLSIFVIAALVIAAMWFAAAAQADAPAFSPVPVPRPLTQPVPLPVQVQTACDTHESIVEKLRVTYGETRRGAGLSGLTAIFEIWASEVTGTWTILKTAPNGWTCLVAVGDSWQDDTANLIHTGDPV